MLKCESWNICNYYCIRQTSILSNLSSESDDSYSGGVRSLQQQLCKNLKNHIVKQAEELHQLFNSNTKEVLESSSYLTDTDDGSSDTDNEDYNHFVAVDYF